MLETGETDAVDFIDEFKLNLFSEEVSYDRMLSAFQSLRVPRHLFRFLFRVLVEHCNRHTDAQPVYKISGETFESTLAVYQRETELSSV